MHFIFLVVFIRWINGKYSNIRMKVNIKRKNIQRRLILKFQKIQRRLIFFSFNVGPSIKYFLKTRFTINLFNFMNKKNIFLKFFKIDIK